LNFDFSEPKNFGLVLRGNMGGDNKSIVLCGRPSKAIEVTGSLEPRPLTKLCTIQKVEGQMAQTRRGKTSSCGEILGENIGKLVERISSMAANVGKCETVSPLGNLGKRSKQHGDGLLGPKKTTLSGEVLNSGVGVDGEVLGDPSLKNPKNSPHKRGPFSRGTMLNGGTDEGVAIKNTIGDNPASKDPDNSFRAIDARSGNDNSPSSGVENFVKVFEAVGSVGVGVVFQNVGVVEWQESISGLLEVFQGGRMPTLGGVGNLEVKVIPGA